MSSLHNQTNAKLCVSLCCCILPAPYRKEKCEENLWKAFRWSWYLEAPLSIVGKEPTKMANDENKGKCKVIQIWIVCNSRVMILKAHTMNILFVALHAEYDCIAYPIGILSQPHSMLVWVLLLLLLCHAQRTPLPGFPTGFPWIHLRGSHGLSDQRAHRTK